VLSRPWCLLECWEAHRHGIPVCPVQIAPVQGQPGFDQAATRAFVEELELMLEAGALAEVKRHLSSAPATIADLKAVLLQQLERGANEEAVAAAKPGVGNTPGSSSNKSCVRWDPCSPDRLMAAASQELCEAMARLTGRTLNWDDGAGAPHKPTMAISRFPIRAPPKQPAPSGFAFFLSYHRAESGPDARVLQAALERELGGGRVFLDVTDATDLSGILTHLASSRALLLSKRVLERPWVLLELDEASRRGLPIVCVRLEGSGYDFAAAKEYLNDLENQLSQCDPAALAELTQRLDELRRSAPESPAELFSLSALQSRLAATLPNLIAISFDAAHGGEHHVRGVAREVADRVKRVGNSAARAGSSAALSGRRKRSVGSLGRLALEALGSTNHLVAPTTPGHASSRVGAQAETRTTHEHSSSVVEARARGSSRFLHV